VKGEPRPGGKAGGSGDRGKVIFQGKRGAENTKGGRSSDWAQGMNSPRRPCRGAFLQGEPLWGTEVAALGGRVTRKKVKGATTSECHDNFAPEGTRLFSKKGGVHVLDQ